MFLSWKAYVFYQIILLINQSDHHVDLSFITMVYYIN